jgi:hypothetical protein
MTKGLDRRAPRRAGLEAWYARLRGNIGWVLAKPQRLTFQRLQGCIGII